MPQFVHHHNIYLAKRSNAVAAFVAIGPANSKIKLTSMQDSPELVPRRRELGIHNDTSLSVRLLQWRSATVQ
jgi:hypothetical protein